MRTLITLCAILTLTACGTGGGSSSSSTTTGTTGTTPPPPAIHVIALSLTTGNTTVAYAGLFDLNVVSADATVAANQSVHTINVSGASNIFVGASSTISGDINIINSAIVHLPVGFSIGGTITTTGSGHVQYDSIAAASNG